MGNDQSYRKSLLHSAQLIHQQLQHLSPHPPLAHLNKSPQRVNSFAQALRNQPQLKSHSKERLIASPFKKKKIMRSPQREEGLTFTDICKKHRSPQNRRRNLSPRTLKESLSSGHKQAKHQLIAESIKNIILSKRQETPTILDLDKQNHSVASNIRPDASFGEQIKITLVQMEIVDNQKQAQEVCNQLQKIMLIDSGSSDICMSGPVQLQWSKQAVQLKQGGRGNIRVEDSWSTVGGDRVKVSI